MERKEAACGGWLSAVAGPASGGEWWPVWWRRRQTVLSMVAVSDSKERNRVSLFEGKEGKRGKSGAVAGSSPTTLEVTGDAVGSPS